MDETTTDIVWDGVRLARTLDAEAVRLRSFVADAAKDARWDKLLEHLKGGPELVNSVRLDSDALFTPLHQAAYNSAPARVVEQLLELGAWRTAENRMGERPVDTAHRRGNSQLYAILEPHLQRTVPVGILRVLERHFHEVILDRAKDQVGEHQLRLPRLEPLLELRSPKMWFPVPGMYGGFSYRLAVDGYEPVLVTESWCRVVEGSGQRHRIEPKGAKLESEGFV